MQIPYGYKYFPKLFLSLENAVLLSTVSDIYFRHVLGGLNLQQRLVCRTEAAGGFGIEKNTNQDNSICYYKLHTEVG